MNFEMKSGCISTFPVHHSSCSIASLGTQVTNTCTLRSSWGMCCKAWEWFVKVEWAETFANHSRPVLKFLENYLMETRLWCTANVCHHIISDLRDKSHLHNCFTWPCLITRPKRGPGTHCLHMHGNIQETVYCLYMTMLLLHHECWCKRDVTMAHFECNL